MIALWHMSKTSCHRSSKLDRRRDEGWGGLASTIPFPRVEFHGWNRNLRSAVPRETGRTGISEFETDYLYDNYSGLITRTVTMLRAEALHQGERLVMFGFWPERLYLIIVVEHGSSPQLFPARYLYPVPLIDALVEGKELGEKAIKRPAWQRL